MSESSAQHNARGVLNPMASRIGQQRGLNLLNPYVPGTPIEEVQRQYGLKDVIKLASNENPLGPSPLAVAAIEDALSKLNYYPDGQSYDLVRALAEHLGPGIQPEHVAVGNGADGIIMQTCMAFLDEASEVIVSRSSFPVYDIYVNVMRAKLIKTPLKDFRLDLEAMAQAITGDTKLIFVCNPNNPTGTIVTAPEVATFMERVPDHVLVIFDEAYFELVDSAAYPESIAYVREGRENVMIMRSFSKAYGIAGIRLGYAIAMPQVLAPLHRVKEPFAVNLLAQAAGVAALSDKAFLQKTVATNDDGRRFLYAAFDRLGLRYLKSHTNFILVEFGPEACELQQQLLRQGVIVRPCVNYDLPDCLRITVGDQAQNVRLIEALESLLPFSEKARSAE
jgi:histidinol-phosphate aminotransferase